MKGIAFRISTLVLTGLSMTAGLLAQDVPSQPLSIPVFHSMVLNPAFVGSKDFTNIALTSRVFNFSSQLINVHKRLKNQEGEYSNIGLGAFAFNEQGTYSWNTGLGLSGSYHMAIDKEHLHNISGGLTLKGIASVPNKGEVQAYDSASTAFTPDLDLGVYYYGPHAFAGLSITSLLESSDKMDSLTRTYASIDRGYHLYGGYKFVLVRDLGIVLEPSILVSLNGETINEPHKHLTPYLKIYLQNFYLGSYLKDFDTFALFFQYQFPKFYTGVFLEFPRVGYLNDENIIFELSMGVNLGDGGKKFLQYRHW